MTATDRIAPEAPIAHVGVIGAGTIGTSVAHAVSVLAALPVCLVDSDAGALERARGHLRRLDRLARLTKSAPAVAAVEMSTDLNALAEVDVVVENITESAERKAALYAGLDGVVHPDAVVAANTSAIPIEQLARAFGDPGRLIGVHFMNPVVQIPMVEIVFSARTSRRSEAVVSTLLAQMGKRSVAVGDVAGFVINRILMGVVNLAAELVDDGVATAAAVDRLFTGCLGHSTGPLRTADLIGLDTVVHTLHVLFDHHQAALYRPHPSLARKVQSGELGVKSGMGFFSYGAQRDGN